MKREREASLRQYFGEVQEEFGIDQPVILSLTKRVGGEPEEGYYSSPTRQGRTAMVVLRRGDPSSVLKRSIRHELAHAKLHGDYEVAYETAEDLVRMEIEADLLAYGSPPPLQYLMTIMVHKFGLGKEAAYRLVRRVALDLGIPQATITRAGRSFRKILVRMGGLQVFKKEAKEW